MRSNIREQRRCEDFLNHPLAIDKYELSIAEAARLENPLSHNLDINRRGNRVRDTLERRISSRTKKNHTTTSIHGDVPLACRTCEYLQTRHKVPLPISLIRYVSLVPVRAFVYMKNLRRSHIKI